MWENLREHNHTAKKKNAQLSAARDWLGFFRLKQAFVPVDLLAGRITWANFAG
jgi:hypothetical protein